VAPPIEVRVWRGGDFSSSAIEEVRGDRWWVVVRRGGEAAGAPPQPWVDGGRWAGLVGLHGNGAEDGVVEDGVEEDSVAR
jgi:hypothetical protein